AGRGLHRRAGELFLGGEPRLALGAKRLGLLEPGRIARGPAVLSQGAEQGLAGLARVGMNADGHGVVAPAVARLDVDLDERRARTNVAVVELAPRLGQAGADGRDPSGETAPRGPPPR